VRLLPTAAGKKRPLVIAAIAREMAAFLWTIGQHVAPTAFVTLLGLSRIFFSSQILSPNAGAFRNHSVQFARN
jgi:hypothetical protein